MSKRLILAAAAAAILAGCASVPMGDPKADTAAKEFRAPANGKAGLYIYRNETFGAAIKMPLLVNGDHIGESASKTYFYQELPPGKHKVTSIAEVNDTIEVDLKPGTLAYVWQEVKMGLMAARSKLHLVGEAEGRKGVLDSKLATK